MKTWCALLAVMFVAAVLFSGCTHNILLKRYESVTNAADATGLGPTADVVLFAFTMNVPPVAQPSVFALSPQGQAAFIRTLAEQFADCKKDDCTQNFVAALAQDIKPATPTDRDTCSPIIKRRLVLQLLHVPKKPADFADRIDSVYLTITFPSKPDEIQVISHDRIETAYETIDLGKVTSTQTSKFNVGGTATVGVAPKHGLTGVTSEFGYERSSELGEEASYRGRFVKLAAFVDENTPNVMNLFMQGYGGIDLTGTVTIDVTLRFPATAPRVWQIDSGALADRRFCTPFDPDSRFDLEGKAVVRHVTKMQRTIPEGDDKVEYLACPLKKQDYKIFPESYTFVFRSETDPPWVLQARREAESEFAEMKFTSRTAAFQVMEYLRTKATDPAARELKVDGFVVSVKGALTFVQGLGDLKLDFSN